MDATQQPAPDEPGADDEDADPQQLDDEHEESTQHDQDDRQPQHEVDEVDHEKRPQFQQFPPPNRFRSPLFSTPPPNFNNARMPPGPNMQSHPNRFWNNNNNTPPGNNNFLPRQWNSPQNFRGGININMQRQQLRGPIPPQLLANNNFNLSTNAGNFNSPRSNVGGAAANNANFNLPPNMGGNLNPLQNQFNSPQGIQVGGGNFTSPQQFNNLNRFPSPQQQALIMVRNHLLSRFNAPQPLMSIVTQNELEDDGGDDGPPSIDEIEDNASPSDQQQNDEEPDNNVTESSEMKTTVDEQLVDFPKGDVDMRIRPPSIVSGDDGGDGDGDDDDGGGGDGNDDDQKLDSDAPVAVSVAAAAAAAGSGGGIGDQSNDSCFSGGRPNSESGSVGGGDQTMSTPKLPRRPNPFSKAPMAIMDTEPSTNFQPLPRALLELPATAPFLPQQFNNNNMAAQVHLMGNTQFSSPRMPGIMGNGGVPGNIRMGGQQQFFSPQQQPMPFSPNQIRGRGGGLGGNGSPYFRQNRGGPIGGPGRPQMGMNRGGGGGVGGHDGGFRGGRGRGNFRGKW